MANPAVARPGCAVDYRVHGSWRGSYLVEVRIKNTSSTAIDGWSLSWTLPSGQSLRNIWGADETIEGSIVTAENLRWNKVIKPSKQAIFGFIGKGDGTEPLLFFLNGKVCTST